MSLGYTWRRQVTRARLPCSLAGARLCGVWWHVCLACARLCLCPGAQSRLCHVRPVGRAGLPSKEPATWGQGRKVPLMPAPILLVVPQPHETECLGGTPCRRRCPSLVGDPAAEEWSPWSVCSLTCGQGLQVRTRSCVSSPYGTLCSGPLRETRPCNNSATCPGRPIPLPSPSACRVRSCLGVRHVNLPKMLHCPLIPFS